MNSGGEVHGRRVLVGGAENALTPIREETENELAEATPARGKKSDGRGRSMSSGKNRMRSAISGRLLPAERCVPAERFLLLQSNV